jgi:uncharacterized protein YPO0396
MGHVSFVPRAGSNPGTPRMQHLDTFRSREEETRRDLDKQLQQVDEELRNIERAILAVS